MKKLLIILCAITVGILVAFNYAARKSPSIIRENEKKSVDLSLVTEVNERILFISDDKENNDSLTNQQRRLLSFVENQINEALFRWTPDGQIAPGMAESIKQKGRQSWIVTLKGTLTYSSGRPATAQSLITSWKKKQLQREPSANDLILTFSETAPQIDAMSLNISAIDARTISVKSPKPILDIRPYLAAPAFYASHIASFEDITRKNLESIGPYLIKSATEDLVSLAKNPTFYDQKTVRTNSFQVVSSSDLKSEPNPLAIIGINVRAALPHKEAGYSYRKHSKQAIVCKTSQASSLANRIADIDFSDELRGLLGKKTKYYLPSNFASDPNLAIEATVKINGTQQIVLNPEVKSEAGFLHSLNASHLWSENHKKQLNKMLTLAMRSPGKSQDGITTLVEKTLGQDSNIDCGLDIWERYLVHPSWQGIYSAGGNILLRHASIQVPQP